MTKPIPANQRVSKLTTRIIWGSIGCLVVCAIILLTPVANFMDSTVAGKKIKFDMELVLLIVGALAIILLFILNGEVNPKIPKLKRLKYGEVEFDFGDSEGGIKDIIIGAKQKEEDSKKQKDDV